MDVHIRLAIDDEISVARTIRIEAAKALTEAHGNGHWSREPSLATLRNHQASGSLYLIETGREVVGTFKLDDKKIGFYRKEWFAEPDAPAGYLLNMAISPSHQRLGIGRAAMDRMERAVGEQGLSALRFDAYDSAAGAGDFYLKCGYTLVHRGTINDTPLLYFEKQV